MHMVSSYLVHLVVTVARFSCCWILRSSKRDKDEANVRSGKSGRVLCRFKTRMDARISANDRSPKFGEETLKIMMQTRRGDIGIWDGGDAVADIGAIEEVMDVPKRAPADDVLDGGRV
ncbi:hypothetical protein Dsin_022555 [Dipteronia sinensis]|uniref:Uncharacterized protein n=1 Tax=Dipteronia sinensis TaxID=43782 RepID=A0AAE0A1Q2_9ROSI|nr:hypothetical protein Dsin_022555 [Dipteronia sinensis]